MGKTNLNGANTCKKLKMNELCKIWYINMSQQHGGVDGKKCSAITTWGMVCGKFGGEDAAVAAMKRKEIKKAKNPDYDADHPDDEPEFMYKIKSKYGTILKNIKKYCEF